jgi:hypothetical protein
MPYTVEWMVENRVILAVCSGVFTTQDAINNTRESAALADQAAASGYSIVHAIANMLAVTKHFSLAEQFSIRNQMRTPANRGWVIIVSNPNSFVRFIGTVAIQLLNLRFRMVGSMEEALSTLQKLDPTLPDLSALAQKDREAKTG